MKRSVLIVDDDRTIRAALALLFRVKGYRVLEAENGREGVNSARGELPDVIMMDLCMPVMTGTDASRQLRQDPQTAHIPIIAHTGNEISGSEWSEVADLFDIMLRKPARPGRILEEIERLLGTGQPEPSAV